MLIFPISFYILNFTEERIQFTRKKRDMTEKLKFVVYFWEEKSWFLLKALIKERPTPC
jgi:hypothetical protein